MTVRCQCELGHPSTRIGPEPLGGPTAAFDRWRVGPRPPSTERSGGRPAERPHLPTARPYGSPAASIRQSHDLADRPMTDRPSDLPGRPADHRHDRAAARPTDGLRPRPRWLYGSRGDFPAARRAASPAAQRRCVTHAGNSRANVFLRRTRRQNRSRGPQCARGRNQAADSSGTAPEDDETTYFAIDLRIGDSGASWRVRRRYSEIRELAQRIRRSGMSVQYTGQGAPLARAALASARMYTLCVGRPARIPGEQADAFSRIRPQNHRDRAQALPKGGEVGGRLWPKTEVRPKCGMTLAKFGRTSTKS